MEVRDFVEVHQQGGRSRRKRGWIVAILPDNGGVRIRTTDGFYITCKNLDYCRLVPLKEVRLAYIDD